MENLPTNKAGMASKDFQSNLKNLRGTFAVEDMRISNETLNNLRRLASGKVTCAELVDEIKKKYTQRI